MRLLYRGEEVMMPADWLWQVSPGPDGLHRIEIKTPGGRVMSLQVALQLAELESSCSKPHVRTPTASRTL